MPVIKSAKKTLRQEKKRKAQNSMMEGAMKAAVKEAKLKPTAKSISEAFSSIDKAVKKYIIHKNKAARVKSSLSKLLGGKKTAVKVETPKKVEKKTEVKVQPTEKKEKPVKKALKKQTAEAKK